MCGIVGYVGFRPARDHLVNGLQKLEYRGYDSAGIALVRPSGIQSIRAVGNLENLREAIDGRTWSGQSEAMTGIGHTRWATHGEVTEENAHPHSDPTGRVQIVLNGIVENWAELRHRFLERGD